MMQLDGRDLRLPPQTKGKGCAPNREEWTVRDSCENAHLRHHLEPEGGGCLSPRLACFAAQWEMAEEVKLVGQSLGYSNMIPKVDVTYY